MSRIQYQQISEFLLTSGFEIIWEEPKENLGVIENESIIGFFKLFASNKEITANWKSFEKNMIQRFATDFRNGGEKTWNTYTFLLCTEVAPGGLLSELHGIEEDFSGTRKVVRSGIRTRDDIVEAFLPVLPTMHPISLQHIDLSEYLADRLKLPPSITEQILNGVSPKEIANAIWRHCESKED